MTEEIAKQEGAERVKSFIQKLTALMKEENLTLGCKAYLDDKGLVKSQFVFIDGFKDETENQQDKESPIIPA